MVWPGSSSYSLSLSILIFGVLLGVCKVVVRLWVEEPNTIPLIDIRTCLLAGVAIIDGGGRRDEVGMKTKGEFLRRTLPFSFFPTGGN